MICMGTIVNVVVILVGGMIGLFFKKLLSERISATIMQGLGLAVIIVGLSGTFGAAFSVYDNKLTADYTLLMIISLALGSLIGELLKIEDKLNSFADYCERRFMKFGEGGGFAQGFVTATLIFCVGSMAIVGALEDGINNNVDILFAKSALDAVSAMIFASTLGIGVLFSAAPVAVYQGTITLLALAVAPYLPDVVVTQMSLVGSILIMGIGFNMLKIIRLKVGNMLPAIFIPIIFNILKTFYTYFH